MTVGYAARSGAVLRGRLAGLRVALDVQHAYQVDKPNDLGTRYELLSGGHLYEAQAATVYAAHAADYLRSRGAMVLTNEPLHGILTGHYWTRNRAAHSAGCQAYLACHVNAGGGDYYLAEYMLGSAGAFLGDCIGKAVRGAFPAILATKLNPLTRGQRGAVCIEACEAPTLAVVLEPFFGDRARLQFMLDTAQLARLGEAIGAGIEAWWGRSSTPVA